jgi:hypothetical protein
MIQGTKRTPELLYGTGKYLLIIGMVTAQQNAVRLLITSQEVLMANPLHSVPPPSFLSTAETAAFGFQSIKSKAHAAPVLLYCETS